MLFFEVAAVAFVTSGQSFIMPRGVGVKDANLQAALPCVWFAALAFDFRSSRVSARVWQLSPCLDLWITGVCQPPSSVLLQPKRQPPAIQIDTLIDSSNRTALFEKNKLIRLAVYPPRRYLSRLGLASKSLSNSSTSVTVDLLA